MGLLNSVGLPFLFVTPFTLSHSLPPYQALNQAPSNNCFFLFFLPSHLFFFLSFFLSFFLPFLLSFLFFFLAFLFFLFSLFSFFFFFPHLSVCYPFLRLSLSLSL